MYFEKIPTQVAARESVLLAEIERLKVELANVRGFRRAWPKIARELDAFSWGRGKWSQRTMTDARRREFDELVGGAETRARELGILSRFEGIEI